jgi:hypothetical protein
MDGPGQGHTLLSSLPGLSQKYTVISGFNFPTLELLLGKWFMDASDFVIRQIGASLINGNDRLVRHLFNQTSD